MSPRPQAPVASREGGFPPARDRWQGLLTLVRARLTVATLALPIGVLTRPDLTEPAWWELWWSLLVVGVLSALFWLGARWRRGFGVQICAQLATDLALVTWMAALTGGRESQFVLFFALVVITGGVLGEFLGGLLAAAGACAAILFLPPLVAALHGAPAGVATGVLPAPGMLIAFLATMGVLAGFLGHRVHHARAALERTALELDRVRVDNDAILRHLASGVITVGETGVVAYVNPAAEQVLGLRSSSARGQKLDAALPVRLAPLRAVIEDSLGHRAPRARVEVTVKSATGAALPLGMSTNVLMHEGRMTGVVAVFQDLTEVREMERRVRRNETLAEVGSLAAVIAHEMRNGLNPISGSIEYLQRELKPEGESAVLMELINIECGRLNRFITDLLTYSRERDLALEPLDLNERLGELCEGLRRDARRPEAVTVQFEPAARPTGVEGDREQLRQVWLNLAYNALEAMSGSGGRLRVSWNADDRRRAIVEFEDTGPGIAAEDLPHVGQPFFTTKKGGTGLGVAIAQRIVERHGGSLSFQSALGRGTVARVVLPGAGAAVARAA
jgi:PAS domain S-box-containing protein